MTGTPHSANTADGDTRAPHPTTDNAPARSGGAAPAHGRDATGERVPSEASRLADPNNPELIEREDG